MFVYFIQLHHWPILLLLLFVRFHIYHKVSENIEIRFRGSVEDDTRLSIESDDEDFSNDQVSYFPNIIVVVVVVNVISSDILH